MTDPAQLLARYDAQVRTAESGAVPPGVTFGWDGPLLRASGLQRGYVTYRDLGGIRGAALDVLIQRTCAFYDARGEAFEWKTHGHDEPPDLAERLAAAGFEAEDEETVFIGRVDDLTAQPQIPAGVVVCEIREPAQLRLVGKLETAVWGTDHSWLAEDLIARIAAHPDNLTVLAARAGSELIAAAWLVRYPGTDFAGLWGGSTLPTWRGKGIYRALVASRALLAAQRGVRYMQVDASTHSAPILRRLGFIPVTTTTPYVHRPPGIGQLGTGAAVTLGR